MRISMERENQGLGPTMHFLKACHFYALPGIKDTRQRIRISNINANLANKNKQHSESCYINYINHLTKNASKIL